MLRERVCRVWAAASERDFLSLTPVRVLSVLRVEWVNILNSFSLM